MNEQRINLGLKGRKVAEGNREEVELAEGKLMVVGVGASG